MGYRLNLIDASKTNKSLLVKPIVSNLSDWVLKLLVQSKCINYVSNEIDLFNSGIQKHIRNDS